MLYYLQHIINYLNSFELNYWNLVSLTLNDYSIMLNQEEEIGPDSQELSMPPVEAPPITEPPMPEMTAPPESKIKSRATSMGYDGEDHDDFMNNYVDDLEGFKKRSEEVNSVLWDAIEADPALKETLKIVAIDGKPFLVAIHSVFTPEELQSLPNDPMYADVENAIQTRKVKLEQKRKMQSDMEANTELSQQAITDFAAENNLTEERATEFLTSVDNALEDVFNGKITKNFLASMFRALNYDKDLGDARQMGEIAGRNANIQAKIIDKPLSDGLPKLQSGGNATSSPEKRNSRMAELAAEDKKRRMI